MFHTLNSTGIYNQHIHTNNTYKRIYIVVHSLLAGKKQLK